VAEHENRRSFGNFFVKGSLQTKIIFQILGAMLLTSLLTVGVLALVYSLKSPRVHFYFTSAGDTQEFKLTNMLGLVLPSLVFAQTASILIGLAIGLFSSRKVAVPIYKFEKWVRQLAHGNLNISLSFRENDEMRDLTIQCNSLVDYYRQIFGEIDQASLKIESSLAAPAVVAEQVKRIRHALGKIELKQD
jgi:methyl-accepting chemotaxis protein